MLPRALYELWEGMEENLNLYEWPHRIVLDHERQHHPQLEKVLRSLGK